MAQYHGSVLGNGTNEITKLGSKNNGLTTKCYGFGLGTVSQMSWNEEKQRDEISIYLDGGTSKNAGNVSSRNFHFLGKYIRNENGSFTQISKEIGKEPIVYNDMV